MSTSKLAWDDFRLIKAIADAGGLTGAAAALNVNHSTVFRRLGQIEEQLGHALFERRKTGYVATSAGEEMTALASRIDDDVTAFGRRLAGRDLAPSGELRVTTTDTLYLHVLLPIFGYTLFAWLTALSKNLHNFIAPLFMASLLVFILMYVRDNLPEKGDLKWLANGYKMFLGHHMPSGRFNAGEKVWFWAGVVVLCLIVSVSGAILLFPNFDQVRATMQQASIVHVIAALLVVAFALGHIYMGTIGVEGAYRNMRDGYTDEAWAKEHHEYWYEEVKAGKGRPQQDTTAKASSSPQVQT